MPAALVIQRVRCRYRVTAGERQAELVRVVGDRLLGTRVAARCAELAGPLAGAGDSVVVVRRLAVRVRLRRSRLDDDAAVAAWGGVLARALARALAGPDGTRVRRFAGRPQYVAAFLDALARGSAGRRWEFEPLADLATLAPSAAAREALLQRA